MHRVAAARPALRHFSAEPSVAAAAGTQSGGVCFGECERNICITLPLLSNRMHSNIGRNSIFV